MEAGAIYAIDSILEHDVLQRAAANAANAADAADGSADVVDGEPDLTPDSTVSLTVDQLKAVISQAVGTALDAQKVQTADLQSQVATIAKERDGLQRVFKVLNVDTASVIRRDRTQGLATDFLNACDRAPSITWVSARTGERFEQRDMSEARRLFTGQRQQLRADMEQYARDNGLLRGGVYASDAPTARTDIPGALLDYLSMYIRETHQGRYVYWQFPFYKLELGKGPGDTIQVPRFRWLTEPTSVADRTLTPGTNLSSSSQNITLSTLSIVLGERGLGSGSPSTSLPVAVPEFYIATSILDLENAVMDRLGHDYQVFEDISIRARYFATTRVVYNNAGSVTVTPASVGTGDDGTLTEQFLNNLYAYMSGLQIPAMDDGCYVLVLNDFALAQYKNSLSNKNQYLTPMNAEQLTMMMQAMTNREVGRTSGYAGTMSGFHIFATNAHSMQGTGTEGVQTETLGVGATLTRTSFAFGRAAVARAVGMEAQMRLDSVNDFGRLSRWTWVSHETTADMDVDPAIAAEQQLRVVEIHTTDISL